MNLWPQAPLAEKKTGDKGRRVIFIRLAGGAMPALAYLLDTDTESCDPKRPMKLGERQRFQGLFRTASFDGTGALNEKQFKQFRGEDSNDHMCEFRVGSHMGRRILAFSTHLDNEATILLATGFNKPNDIETPPKEKARARAVYRSFLNSRSKP